MELIYDASRVKGYEGKALLKMPKYRDRLQMIKACQFKFDKDGNVEGGLDNLDGLLKMIEFTSKAVEKLKVKHVASGSVAETFDQLELNPVFDQLVSDISGFYLNAGKMGNSQDQI